MCEVNQTQVTQIRLLGFHGLAKYKSLLFIVFLVTYLIILGGNLLIIILVTTVDHLKLPMFFFLKHLATADVLLTTSVVPMMLDIIFIEEGRLSFVGCITQLYAFGIFGFVQCFLIAVMSYDRYLAVCKPLHYALLMNPCVCLQLVLGSWFLVTLVTSYEIMVLVRFNFCGINYIDNFFCDFGPVVELSTSDTSSLMLQDFILSVFVIFCPFSFILITYMYIFFIILKISSAYGRRKAFSTCSSHLATVCVYYGTLITEFMVPGDESTASMNKYRSLLYTVVTPLMNPIIYSLRNQEIKKALLIFAIKLKNTQL
ncbi:olfactory receptor 10A7-like [Rana temporaria]|uniref:olfactory receptor 10A7-like n=1 Tax=Rana temporaria TaxID=8407 RepID=UPI001AADF10F|nr:olfactory receptor 10A7-like [Rana temporaria]